LQPVRQFIYGLTLCFLAALLATEAKAAWAANGAGVPSDLSAIKLCPAGIKRVEISIAPAPHPPLSPVDSVVLSADTRPHLLLLARGYCESDPPGPAKIAELPFFSQPLFQRPPPDKSALI